MLANMLVYQCLAETLVGWNDFYQTKSPPSVGMISGMEENPQGSVQVQKCLQEKPGVLFHMKMGWKWPIGGNKKKIKLGEGIFIFIF